MNIEFKNWKKILNGAKARNIDVNITQVEALRLIEKQNFKCNLSGVTINLNKDKISDCTASLDRICSNKDYNIENCQWLHKLVNMSKGALSQNSFITMCNDVVKHCKSDVINWNNKNNSLNQYNIDKVNNKCFNETIKDKSNNNIKFINSKIGSWNIGELKIRGSDRLYLCKCDCGSEKLIRQNFLLSKYPVECLLCTKNFGSKILCDNSFGCWYIIERVGYDLWKCKCTCGNIEEKSSLVLYSEPKKCAKCFDYLGEIRFVWPKIKNNAMNRNIKLDISPQESICLLKSQQYKCYFSGKTLTLPISRNRNELYSASLDRLDPTKCYSLNNCVWVHKRINTSKLSLSQKEFYSMCLDIVNNNKNFQEEDWT